MANIIKLYSRLSDIKEEFKRLELNGQVLTRYASPARLNLSRIEDLEAHYLSDETQNVLELVSEDLIAQIKEIKAKLELLTDSLYFDYIREADIEVNLNNLLN